LIELLISLTLALLIMGSVMQVFRQGVTASYASQQRAELQQNARVALNLMSQDVSVAGTGFPDGGIQLPTGAGSTRPKRGCSTASCGAWNFLSDDRLYSVTPGDGLGPTMTGVTTDVMTVAYQDTSLTLQNSPLVSINSTGTQVTAAAGTSAGIVVGDIIMLSNTYGSAVGVVTSLGANDVINFANGDSLNINQTAAAMGNISSIDNPASAGVFPPTTAYRLFVVTYFIDSATNRLMRQVNAQTPVPVAEVVDNMQITYDTFNDATMSATADLPSAGNVPNQIRKANMTINVRAPYVEQHNGKFDRFSLKTSVSVRNLSFFDRYS
jgi:Tfp pilus assembly protein PilW